MPDLSQVTKVIAIQLLIAILRVLIKKRRIPKTYWKSLRRQLDIYRTLVSPNDPTMSSGQQPLLSNDPLYKLTEIGWSCCSVSLKVLVLQDVIPSIIDVRLAEPELRWFNRALKRILAILLLTVFGLPFATPLFASSRTSEASVPACCRRNGKHHCTGNLAAKTDLSGTSQLRNPAEKCPVAPQASVPVHHETNRPSISASIFASVVSHPCGSAQTESMWRVSRDRSRPKRGPPASLLS
jgi:hypothetical protein